MFSFGKKKGPAIIYDHVFPQHHDSEVQSLWSKLQPKIPEYFKGLDVQPSLLHGDLWGGNAAETDSKPGNYYETLGFQLTVHKSCSG